MCKLCFFTKYLPFYIQKYKITTQTTRTIIFTEIALNTNFVPVSIRDTENITFAKLRCFRSYHCLNLRQEKKSPQVSCIFYIHSVHTHVMKHSVINWLQQAFLCWHRQCIVYHSFYAVCSLIQIMVLLYKTKTYLNFAS